MTVYVDRLGVSEFAMWKLGGRIFQAKQTACRRPNGLTNSSKDTRQ